MLTSFCGTRGLGEAAKAFAQAIIDDTPDSADQSAAIRLVREATWTANSAIALEGKLGK